MYIGWRVKQYTHIFSLLPTPARASFSEVTNTLPDTINAYSFLFLSFLKHQCYLHPAWQHDLSGLASPTGKAAAARQQQQQQQHITTNTTTSSSSSLQVPFRLRRRPSPVSLSSEAFAPLLP